MIMIYFRSVLILLVMFMFAGQGMAADVKVNPQGYLATQGETFELNITIDPKGTAIAGAQLNIAFDTSNIRINKITEGNFLKQNGSSTFFSEGIINNSTGTVLNIFGVVLGRINVSSTGTFVVINATAIGISGTSGINLSNVKLSNSDAQPVLPAVYNGSITINSPPVLALIGDKKVFEGQTLTFALSASDPGSNVLTYSASNLPAGATFDPSARTFRWTPDSTRSGVYQNVHFEVSDGILTDSENISITVFNPVNIAVAPSSKTVNPGQKFNLNISIDPLGTPIAGAQLSLTYDASILHVNSVSEGNLFKQNGANTIFNSGVIDNQSGTVSNIYGTIIDSQNVTTPGTLIVVDLTAVGSSGISGVNITNIMISDQDGAPVAFNLTSGRILMNSPPVLGAVGNRIVNENQTLTFTLSATDPDGDSLIYSAANLPSGAVFFAANRTFRWTPDYTQSGNYPAVHFEVYDGGLADSEDIMINVTNINRPPTFDSFPYDGSTFNETQIIPVTVMANDPDYDTLSYIIRIDGVQVSTEADYFWVTGYSSSGTHNITISVNDGTVSVTGSTIVYINNVYPRYDVNENGIVDIGDLTIIGQNFNKIVSAPYPRYDVNMDGIVDISDVTIAAQHFGENT